MSYPAHRKPKTAEDLSGRTFTRWTVVASRGLSSHNKARWECRCTCGHVSIVDAASLLSGKSKSCGCLKSEVAAGQCRSRTTHGMSKSAAHNVWMGIVQRCRNPDFSSYPAYGGRGIKVCEFIAAHPGNIEKLIGPRPKFTKLREYSVDRVENMGHYSCGQCPECQKLGHPMNLRWATQKQQMRNVGYNRKVMIDGVTKCVAEWAEIAGLKYATVLGRVYRGWTGKEILEPIAA